MPKEGDDLPKAAEHLRARSGLPTRASAQPAAHAAAAGGGGGSATAASAETPGKVALARASSRAVAKRAREDAVRAAAAADSDRETELEAALEAEVARADIAEARLIEVESALQAREEQLAAAVLRISSKPFSNAEKLAASVRRKETRLRDFKEAADGLTSANVSLRHAVAAAEATATAQADEILALTAELDEVRSAARAVRFAAPPGPAEPPAAPHSSAGGGGGPAAGADDDDDNGSAASDESAETILRTMRAHTAETAQLIAASAAAAPPPSAAPFAAPGDDDSWEWDAVSGSTGGLSDPPFVTNAAPAPATPPPAFRGGGGDDVAALPECFHLVETLAGSATYDADAPVIYFHAHDEPPFGALSQWTASAFSEELIAGEVDCLTGSTIAVSSITDYGSAEQYVMAEKARLMGDERTLTSILAAVDPAAVKALGRAVFPYDDARWAAARYDVAVRCNMHKFAQNVDMRLLLFSTGDQQLAEAAPRDPIWGIGITAAAALAGAPWQGQNLLGHALMEVRSRLRQHSVGPTPHGSATRMELAYAAHAAAARNIESLVPGPGIVADLDAGVWVRGEILTREVPGCSVRAFVVSRSDAPGVRYLVPYWAVRNYSRLEEGATHPFGSAAFLAELPDPSAPLSAVEPSHLLANRLTGLWSSGWLVPAASPVYELWHGSRERPAAPGASQWRPDVFFERQSGVAIWLGQGGDAGFFERALVTVCQASELGLRVGTAHMRTGLEPGSSDVARSAAAVAVAAGSSPSPRCSRYPACPCTSRWPGHQFCCHTCARGRPCSFNAHPAVPAAPAGGAATGGAFVATVTGTTAAVAQTVAEAQLAQAARAASMPVGGAGGSARRSPVAAGAGGAPGPLAMPAIGPPGTVTPLGGARSSGAGWSEGSAGSGSIVSAVSDASAYVNDYAAPTALDMPDSRGRMIPPPSSASMPSPGGAAAVGAPTPIQEHVVAAKAGAQAQAMVALHSKHQLDALEEKDARGRPDAERHIFELFRWIASNGNSNKGYLGTDAAEDSAAPTPMSVLGDDSAAARAREDSKLPISEGGLFFTSRTSGTATNPTGQGFYAAVAAACADRYLCHVRFGVNFVVTHRVIEAFARVDFSRETGVTPDWTTRSVGSSLLQTAPLGAAEREHPPPLIESVETYKKACRAFGTFFPPTYGTEVKLWWDRFVDRCFALSSTNKWPLVSTRRMIETGLRGLHHDVRLSINNVKDQKRAESTAAGVGYNGDDPSVTDLVRMADIPLESGALFVRPPYEWAFNSDEKDVLSGSPLACDYQKALLLMIQRSEGTISAAAQAELNEGWIAATARGKASAAEARKEREKEKKAEKAKKKADKEKEQDPPAASSRGKGALASGTELADDGSAAESAPASARSPGRGRGEGPRTGLLFEHSNQFLERARAGYGRRCLKHLCNDGCKRSDAECDRDHDEPLTEAEIAKLPQESRIWAISFGDFVGRTSVPWGARRGHIERGLAAAASNSQPGSRGEGAPGGPVDLGDRAREQYGPVMDSDRPLQQQLGALLRGESRDVYATFPESPRHRTEQASDAEADAASGVAGLSAHQRAVLAQLREHGHLAPLDESLAPHRLFIGWLAVWISERVAPGDVLGAVNWQGLITRALLPAEVRASPVLRAAACLMRPRSRGAGVCPVSGEPPLVVFETVSIPGVLRRAAVHVFGIPMVAHEVGYVVIDDLGAQRTGLCVIKTDSVSDLLANGQTVDEGTLAIRAQAFALALAEEAAQMLESVGEPREFISMPEAEARESSWDRTTWSEADVHYALTLGGVDRTSDVLALDPTMRRKIVIAQRRTGGPVHVYVIDGENYDGGAGCWVAYSLLHDYHNRPMSPVDVEYATPAGGERVLAAAATLGVPSTRRMARGWRALCAQPGEALVPAALFHDVDGRFRISSPEVTRGGVLSRGGRLSRAGRAEPLGIFDTVPSRITEWLLNWSLGPPPAAPGPALTEDGGSEPCGKSELCGKDADGDAANDQHISRGSQTRSAAGAKWEHLTLSALRELRPHPDVLDKVVRLADIAEIKFDSKAVRRGEFEKERLEAHWAEVLGLMDEITAHYSDWREAFAVFQAEIFRRRGPLADPQTQEKLRGVLDDEMLNYIQETTEHFVESRIDGQAPTSFQPVDPFKSALEAATEITIAMYKDFSMGVLWVVGPELEHLLLDVATSPLGAVPKRDTATLLMTGAMRIIHAHNKGVWPINDRTPRARHPPAACPQHQEPCLYVVWLCVNFPGLRIGGAKYDVGNAFRNRLVHLSDANYFATRIPVPGTSQLSTAFCGGLTFGWTESPGEYGITGWGVSQSHCRSGPPEAELNSLPDLPHWNSTFVDDGVVLELMNAGARSATTRLAYLNSMITLMSVSAPSADKIAVEGVISQLIMLWGLELDLHGLTPLTQYLRMPNEKVKGGLARLDMPEHAIGVRAVRLRAHIAFTSYFQYLSTVIQSLKPFVSALWAVTSTETREWVDPVGSPSEKARAWLEVDEAKAMLRLTLELGAENPGLLQRSLLFVIDPVDAAAVPNGLRIVVAGSDADGFDEENGGIISAGDLTHGVSYVGFGEDYVAYLRRHHEVNTKSEIIFVLETLALVALACERCSVWRDSLVFFAVDSDNAKHAVNNKTSRNAYVRYLLAILTMLEVRFHFRIVAVYVWTKHNVFFDQIGRRLKRDDADWLKSAQEYADEQAPGMVVKEFTSLLEYFTRGGSVMNTLALPWDRPGSASTLVPWPTMPDGDTSASSELEVPGVPLNIEPLLGGIELAAGGGKLLRQMASEGLPALAAIENHLGKGRFLDAMLPGLVICRDYYSDDWLEWSIDRCDWVGGGPPCVWSSPAGRQDPDDPRKKMFVEGIPRMARRFRALVLDIEQPLEAITLHGGCEFEKLLDGIASAGCRITPPSPDLPGGVEVIRNADDGGSSVRNRADIHAELLDMIHTLGEAPRLEHMTERPVTIRDALVPMATLDPRTFVRGTFHPYTSVRPLTTRPTLVGYIDLGGPGAQLQFGSLCEMGCTVGSDGRGIKCGSAACIKCDGRWRLYRFQGGSAGTFILYNRTAPRRWRCSLEHVHTIASFRRPVSSLDGIANPQTAWGEGPEGPGKTLILDTRFKDEIVVRPLHLLESSRLLEAPDSEIELYQKLNPNADEEELRRFIGDGMARRYVNPVARRTVRRLLEYKFALAVRRATRAVVPLQRRWRARVASPRLVVAAGSSSSPPRCSRYPACPCTSRWPGHPFCCHTCAVGRPCSFNAHPAVPAAPVGPVVDGGSEPPSRGGRRPGGSEVIDVGSVALIQIRWRYRASQRRALPWWDHVDHHQHRGPARRRVGSRILLTRTLGAARQLRELTGAGRQAVVWGLTRLQAQRRGWLGRNLAARARRSRHDLDRALADLDPSDTCHLRTRACGPYDRASAAAIYGSAVTSDSGLDDAPGSRGGGGRGKLNSVLMRSGDAEVASQAGVHSLLSASVHTNTAGTYASAAKPWFGWRILHRQSLYLDEDLSNKEKQTVLLRFYSDHAWRTNWSPAWLHVQLYAVRHYHILADCEYDYRVMLRLALAKKGWRRLWGSEKRKVAVTVELLLEAYAVLDVTSWDDLVLITAISTAFGFLMRSAEYSRKGASPDPEKCLRVEHVVCALGGSDCHAPRGVDCDEVVVFHPGAKNDWLGQGSSANIYADPGGSPLCVVRLFNLMRRAKPNYFKQHGKHLFTLQNGSVLARTAVDSALKSAAERLRWPVDTVSTHSLRAGGATAMWAAGKTAEEIQRRGRWASQCFRIYIWESREKAASVAEAIYRGGVSLFAGLCAVANAQAREVINHAARDAARPTRT